MFMANPAGQSTGHLDVFFRHMVGNMRNGVLAIDRRGGIVLLNDEARRLFQLRPGAVDGLAYADVLGEHPDILRVLGGAFELKSLPNRAELRLKSTDTVIGYTLSLVRDDHGEPVGAALFFKDLTHVEQIEERERLRDRLAAVGEMAATMAHEIKNPLAGIEVLAGLLRRKVPDNEEAQGLVKDIINEAKMANAIVMEVLAFVRPVRLQVDRTSLPEAIASAVVMADGKATRGSILVDTAIPQDLPLLGADQHQLQQVFSNLLINAYEALEGRGRIEIAARIARTAADVAAARWAPAGGHRGGRRLGRRPGHAGRRCREDFQSVLHDQGAGHGAGPRGRAQDRGRARRPHRHDDRGRPRHEVPGHASS